MVRFRSLGWVWSDDELTSVLFPGERGASEKEKFSAVELLRAADAHANERCAGGHSRTE